MAMITLKLNIVLILNILKKTRLSPFSKKTHTHGQDRDKVDWDKEDRDKAIMDNKEFEKLKKSPLVSAVDCAIPFPSDNKYTTESDITMSTMTTKIIEQQQDCDEDRYKKAYTFSLFTRCQKFNAWQIVSILLALVLLANWLHSSQVCTKGCGERGKQNDANLPETNKNSQHGHDHYYNPSEPNYWNPIYLEASDMSLSNLGLTIKGRKVIKREWPLVTWFAAQWPLYDAEEQQQNQQPQLNYDETKQPAAPPPPYYEVEIVKWDMRERQAKRIGIGLGCESWAAQMYFMSTGALWGPGDYATKTGAWSTFGEGDTVGCGLLRSSDEAFFTKNGEVIGKQKLYTRNNNNSSRIHPVLCLFYDEIELRANFGYDLLKSPFKYNVTQMNSEEM